MPFAGLGEGHGARIIVVFEGRDAAGKGGTIKALTERVSPRVFRVMALPAPSDREKSQMFMQRYMQQFPAAGEIVIFDRSWYNRAGVEYVMDSAASTSTSASWSSAAGREVCRRRGIKLIKIWLEVGQAEQEKRFRPGSTIRCGNGNSVQWTSDPTRDGTTTRRRAT